MPANEGGTHGLCERVRSDGESVDVPMNAGIQENLTGRAKAGRYRSRDGGSSYSRPPTGSRPYRAARRTCPATPLVTRAADTERSIREHVRACSSSNAKPRTRRQQTRNVWTSPCWPVIAGDRSEVAPRRSMAGRSRSNRSSNRRIERGASSTGESRPGDSECRVPVLDGHEIRLGRL